jgi:hypothetical protein
MHAKKQYDQEFVRGNQAPENQEGMPPPFPSAMPEQEIAIWTPARAGFAVAILIGRLATPLLRKALPRT